MDGDSGDKQKTEQSCVDSEEITHLLREGDNVIEEMEQTLLGLGRGGSQENRHADGLTNAANEFERDIDGSGIQTKQLVQDDNRPPRRRQQLEHNCDE